MRSWIPAALAEAVKEQILALRRGLLARGLDARAETNGWHLACERITISRATIWRILTEPPWVSRRVLI